MVSSIAIAIGFSGCALRRNSLVPLLVERPGLLGRLNTWPLLQRARRAPGTAAPTVRSVRWPPLTGPSSSNPWPQLRMTPTPRPTERGAQQPCTRGVRLDRQKTRVMGLDPGWAPGFWEACRPSLLPQGMSSRWAPDGWPEQTAAATDLKN